MTEMTKVTVRRHYGRIPSRGDTHLSLDLTLLTGIESKI
jgi:hypothetical protein